MNEIQLLSLIVSGLAHGARALEQYNSMKTDGVPLTPEQLASIQATLDAANDRWDRVKNV